MLQAKPIKFLLMLVVCLLMLKAPAVSADFTQAEITQIKEAATSGSSEAQYSLSIIYEVGIGVPEDHVMALNWCAKAAEQGHAEAQYRLGHYYADGEGVPKDDAMAAKLWKKAAKQGYRAAQTQLMESYYYGNAMPEWDPISVGFYREEVENGSESAMHVLGIMYLGGYGLGVPQDYQMALKWFNKADSYRLRNLIEGIISGDPYSYGKIGDYFRAGGWYLPKDEKMAVHFYTLAAEAGDTRSQLYLAERHFNNSPRNLLEAFKWYKLSADGGNAVSMNKLGFMYEFGLGVEKDYSAAFNLYRKAAKKGMFKAKTNLGRLYTNGYGVKKNDRNAQKWFKSAARDIKTFKHSHPLIKRNTDAETHYGLGKIYSLGYSENIGGVDHLMLAAQSGIADFNIKKPLLYDSHLDTLEAEQLFSASYHSLLCNYLFLRSERDNHLADINRMILGQSLVMYGKKLYFYKVQPEENESWHDIHLLSATEALEYSANEVEKSFLNHGQCSELYNFAKEMLL